jgi:Fis family transcriptional regulator
MNILEDITHRRSFQHADIGAVSGLQSSSTLRKEVERSMDQYFAHLGEASVTNLYDLVLNEVEGPLLEAVLKHTGSNQSKASIMLGLNRGTLRKKLKQHGML